ncbi:unnamed protein product [Linum trigynum]|uniref:Uncharacterized protein n=1 Tax=Linum trigynum TaxID=586398 RepID=A0AAV2EUL0_9ROSI
MRVESIEYIAWKFAIQCMLAEERWKMREEVVEVVEANEEEFIEDPQEDKYKEGKELDEANGFRMKEEVLVVVAYIGHEIILKSPPNFKEFLIKDPFVITLCSTKTTPSSLFLDG